MTAPKTTNHALNREYANYYAFYGNIMSDTPRTDRAANESIAAVYEESKKLEIELQRVTQCLITERQWLARDFEKLREIKKQLNDIVK
jgi:hypothetical protein